MDIKHVFDDSRIVMLEKEIATINEHCRYTDEENHLMKHLLETRRNVLWHLNVYDDETKRLLTDFNAALRKCLHGTVSQNDGHLSGNSES